jgi:4-hydroxy-tetrahydrodipicolinate synthase
MINGSIVDLIIPTASDGSPDYKTVDTLIDWHIDNGSAALLIGSATGQHSEFNNEERGELLKRAIWQSDGRIVVIANLDTSDPDGFFELARAADEFGADAGLLTLPTSMGLSQVDLLEYVRELAKFAKLPLILRDDFSHPNLLSPTTLPKLAEIEGIIGLINDSSQPTPEDNINISELPSGFALYAGHNTDACQWVLAGYQGGISLVGNIAPALVKDMISAAQQNNRALAMSFNDRLRPLTQALMTDPSANSVTWALTEMGCIPEGEHPPSLPQSSDYAQLRRALRTAQVII